MLFCEFNVEIYGPKARLQEICDSTTGQVTRLEEIFALAGIDEEQDFVMSMGIYHFEVIESEHGPALHINGNFHYATYIDSEIETRHERGSITDDNVCVHITETDDDGQMLIWTNDKQFIYNPKPYNIIIYNNTTEECVEASFATEAELLAFAHSHIDLTAHHPTTLLELQKIAEDIDFEDDLYVEASHKFYSNQCPDVLYRLIRYFTQQLLVSNHKKPPMNRLSELIELMQHDLHEYEQLYQGQFAENPHVSLGNRKTRCINEATLPIVTCHPSCTEKCAATCYVINIMTFPRPNCRRCQARNTVLRRIDPARYYEFFYQEAERLNLPIRLSDGGDFENAEQVQACIAAARRHPAVQAIGYTKRIELLTEFQQAPANMHIRYSTWEHDEQNTELARRLGFNVSSVVYDGSGNCPYQISIARFRKEKASIAKDLRNDGVDTKTANKLAEKKADQLINVHHCRNCAQKQCGCFKDGQDIRFNVVK